MTLSARLLLSLSIAPVLIAQSQFQSDVLALNPLGFWPLYGNATDLTNNHNNGTLTNGVNFTGSVTPLGAAASPAAVFASAQGQYITMPTAGSSIFNLGALHPLTAMAWIRTENQGQAAMVILGKFDPVAKNGWVLGIDNGAFGASPGGGSLVLTFDSSGTLVLVVESTVAVNDGNWHLVAATYSGSGAASGVHLYVDGVSVGATTLVDSIGGSSILNNASFTIGELPGGGNGGSPFEGNINEVAVFGTVLTPAQILKLDEDAAGSQSILPQFAFGGGWYSAVYFSNNGTNTVSFQVNFVADGGGPLAVPSISGSSTTLTLAPGATATIVAPNTGDLVEGYVAAVLPPGVTGYGLFRQSVAGIADQEGVANLSPATAQFQSLTYDETNNLVTAAAIVNPGAAAITVAITAVDTNGNLLGSVLVPVQPFSKTEAVVHSYAGLGGMVGKQGTVRFTVTAGSVAVIGFRFNGAAFTQIPATGAPTI